MTDVQIVTYCIAAGFFLAAVFIGWNLFRHRHRPEVFNEDDFVEVARPDVYNMGEHWAKEPEAEVVQLPVPQTSYIPQVELRPDAPLAPVFQISESPLDRLESWAAEAAQMGQKPVLSDPRKADLENYYMIIGPEYAHQRHSFLPEMKPTQWVRIISPTYEQARTIAYHFSGGYYLTLKHQSDFLADKDNFPFGEYETLSTEDYWDFQSSAALD